MRTDLLLFISLGALVVSLVSCDSLKPSSSKDEAKSGLDTSDAAGGGTGNLSPEQQAALYEQTVYQVVNGEGDHCSTCHGNVTAPFFASEDSLEAFRAASENKKMNLTNPEMSRMVQRLRDEKHNCWSDCEEDAVEMEKAIAAFAAKVKDAGGGVGTQVDPESVIRTDLAGLTYYPKLPTTVMLEFEDGEILDQEGTAVASDSDASGDSFVNIANDRYGIAVRFHVPKAGYYSLMFRGKSSEQNNEEGSRYSIIINGPGMPAAEIDDLEFANSAEWAWQAARKNNSDTDLAQFYFQAQEYTIAARDRSDSMGFDQIAITDDPKFEGASFQPQTASQTLTYDLTAAVVKKFPDFKGEAIVSVDVEANAEGSYIFRSPRLLTTKVPMTVSGMRFLYSGKYSDQYQTFEDIDAEVAPGQFQILLTSAMVVLQDKKPQDDMFAFEFEVLQPVK